MHTSKMKMITESTKDTESLGEKLAEFLKPGDLVALTGELGSGKTTFTKGIARGLEVEHPEYVNSPSFVLIREYRGRFNLYHFDFYRLDDLADMEYIGINEYLEGDGIVVIEWAQKLKNLLPPEYIKIDIKILDNNRREFTFKGHGKRSDNIIGRYLKR